MEVKERDLFTTMVASPKAVLDDLIVAGYNLDNTALLSKDVYKNDDWVQNLFKDLYGNFDENKFNNYYNLALSYYNNLSSKTSDEIINNDLTYHRSNLMAPEDKKRKGPDFREIKMANPYEQSYGLITPGIVENPTKSIDELAQSHKVLANPTTAGPNFENAKWEDTPNGHFWKYFRDTLVLAQYDEDGEHNDPFTGQVVQHKKGDLRLNDEGQFYYEKLDGRTVYGRKVLNKLNVITTDGSKLNKYDFFDSDDLEQKSIAGTVLKNAALVGSMWLPYIGPVILGITLATLLTGLAATLGKMIVGSDNATLSALEGWAQSMDRRGAKTEYAQQHPIWCWESFIDMIGDFAEIGRVQRFLFADVPAVFTGGKNLLTEGGLKAMLLKLTEARAIENEAKIATLVKDPKAINTYTKNILELRSPLILSLQAQADLAPLVKNYLKIGEIISRGYMALSIGSNAYAEAKTAGASDIDATLLTLGYMGSLYGFLSLGVNKFIFPELRAEGYKTKSIAKALLESDKDTQRIRKTLESASLLERKMYAQKMFKLGRNIANAEYANGTKTLIASAASGIGMAVEGTGFELLSDLSRGCYDVVKWLQGEDHRMTAFGYMPETGEWDIKGTLGNYTGTFLSAILGGSLTNMLSTYKGMRSMKGLTHQQAMNELVSLIRNGQDGKFLRDISKMELAPSTLSSEITESGLYAPGTKDNNQNLDAFRMINQAVNEIREILLAYGGDLSDDSFLTRQTLGDIRFAKIFSGTVKGAALNEYNILNAKNIRLIDQIRGLEIQKRDLNGDNIVEDSEKYAKIDNPTIDKQLTQLRKELKEIAKLIQDLVDGKRSYEFINASLFEALGIAGEFMDATFLLYCENKTGKKYEELTEIERKNAWDEYEIWKSSIGRDRLMDLAKIFNRVTQESSNSLKEVLSDYLKVSDDLNKFNEIVSKLYETTAIEGLEENFINLNQLKQDSSQGYIIDTLIKLFDDNSKIEAIKEDIVKIHNDKNLTKEEKDSQFQNKYIELSQARRDGFNNALHEIIKPFIERGYITSEAKQQILRAFDTIKKYTDNERRAVEAGKLAVDDIESYYDAITDVLSSRGNFARSRAAIEELTESPLEKNINQFLYSIKGDPLKLSELILKLNILLDLTSDNITNFLLDQETLGELLNAINAIKLYRAALLAARTDAVGIDNIYGYNTTLNEISKKLDLKHPELAELPSEVVDILVSDIDTNLNKLVFLRNLYYINKGQKLSLQDRIATHTEMLLYNRMRTITAIKEDDPLSQWSGFSRLRSIVDSMLVHNALNEAATNNVSSENRGEFEKEKIRMENAIYEFFQENQDKVNNVDKLMELVNPLRLQLYTNADNILNEGLTAIDDNSFLWYLASRAAIKSSDFYYQYLKMLGFDPRIAPIATLEHAVFINYANVVNGDIFTRFSNAFRKSIVKDWKNKIIDERERVLRSLGVESDSQISFLSQDDMADYCLGSLPVVRYKNIIFTEGIPGSGKTSAVIKQVIKLLQQTNPNLLKDVLIVHGVSEKSAETLKNDIGIDGDIYDRASFMTFLSKAWENLEVNIKEGTIKIPTYATCMVEDNISGGKELKSTTSIDKKSTVPNLIVIDEIGQFSTYDVDIIQNFASQHGITVITAGDLDQTHIIGNFDININGETFTDTASLERTMFVRSPKLGVSMRTDNSIKTENQSKMLMSGGKITFNWFKNKNGLYGDKVIQYGIEEGENIEEGISNGKLNILDWVLEEVDYLMSTLLENEKIGYIYSDNNSPIYNKLSSTKYKNVIDFKQGNLSQGLEGQYYIVECDDLNAKDYRNRIYTGMTRARQGSLLIISSNSDISSKEVLEVIGEKLSDEIIARYTKERKKLLGEVVPLGDNIAYKERTLKDNFVINERVVKELKNNESENEEFTGNPAISLLPDIEFDKNAFDKQLNEIIIPYLVERQDIATPDEFNSDSELLGLFDDYPSIQALIRENQVDNFIRNIIKQANNIRIEKSFNLDGFLKLPFVQDLMRYMDTDTKEEFILIIKNKVIPYIVEHPEAVEDLFDDDEIRNMFESSTAIMQAFESYKNYLNKDALTKFLGFADNSLEEYLGQLEQIINNKILPYLVDHPLILTYDQFMNDGYIYKHLISPFSIQIKETEPEFEDFVGWLIDDARITRRDNDDNNSSTELTIYTDDAPIIDLGETNALDDYFDAQQSESIPTTEVKKVGDVLKINGIYSTHNSYELGMKFNPENGKFSEEYYSEYFAYFKPRIDGLNGLVKLIYNIEKVEDLLGIEKEDIDKMINALTSIRSILFNVKDKNEILLRIQGILDLEENLYLTFAIKKSPKSNDDKEYVELPGKATPFSKGKSEGTIDNLSDDINSDEHNITQLIAIIGSKDRGNFLEIPLSTLPSPITAIRADEAFGDLRKVFDAEYRRGKSVYKALQKVIERFDKNNKYRDIINLCKLYTYGDRLIYFIKDNSWTLANNSTLFGPQFVTEAGRHLVEIGYKFNNYTPLIELSLVHGLKMSSTPMVSIKGTYQSDSGEAVEIANPGHTFILVSADVTINQDKLMLQYYANQLANPKDYPPKIIRAYVVPPKATMREYLDNVKNILIDKSYRKKPIGELVTSYRIFEKLIKDERFKKLLKKTTFHDLKGNPVDGAQLFKLLESTIKEGIFLNKKNYLKNPAHTKDWNVWTHSGKEMYIADALDRTLINLAYSFEGKGKSIKATINDEMVNLISEIYPEVYYNFKYDRKGESDIKSIKLDENYKYEGKSCCISGKIVTPVFLIDLGDRINDFVEGITILTSNTGNDHYYYIDNDSYIKKVYQYETVSDNIAYIKSRTKVDVSGYYKGNVPIKLANIAAVSEINANDLNACAFIIGDQVKIGTSESEIFKGKHYILLENAYDSNISSTKDKYGVYHFKVIDDDIIYDATYDGENLTLIPLLTEVKSNVSFKILNTEFNENLQNTIKEALTSNEDFWDIYYDDPFFDGILNAKTQEDLDNVIKNYEKDEYREKELREFSKNIVDENQKSVIENLIEDLTELEKSNKDPNKCSLKNITLKV